MGFDRVARPYRFLEQLVYGGALQSARVAHLGAVEGRRRVLVLGDGDGRFLEALLERAPEIEVEVVEASAKMIELARRRIGETPRVKFHHMAIEEFQPQGKFDLVASHFFLDCFREGIIESIVELVSESLAGGGEWLISDFQIPPSGWLNRVRARVLLWLMYRFFGLMAGLKTRRLVDPQTFLEAGRFVLRARVTSNAGFLRADRWGVDPKRFGKPAKPEVV